MDLNSFQFHPQPLPTAVAALSVSLLVVLGMWQLDRADQKQSVAAIREARKVAAPLMINGGSFDQKQVEYRSFTARGEYLAEKTLLIDNRKHLGRNGFHVLTPLYIAETNRYLLVNRGWIPTAPRGSMLEIPTPGGVLEVNGEARIPQPPPIKLLKADTSSPVLPRWPYMTLEDYQSWSDLNIYPFTLLQDGKDTHGFVRAWPVQRSKHGMHIGYAIQWFAFALIVPLIWFKLSLQSALDSAEEK